VIAHPADVVARLRGPSARRGAGPVAWLDGALDADRLGRWSFIGADPVGAVFAWGTRVLHLDAQGRRRREDGCPFAALWKRVQALGADLAPPAADDPRPFRAGAVGWLGSELGRTIERL